MRTVDFQTFPDSSELRGRLLEAFDGVDVATARDAHKTEPIDPSSPLGIGFPADLDDDAVRERAETLRGALSAALGGDAEVRFQVADGSSETAGGSPDHLE